MLAEVVFKDAVRVRNHRAEFERMKCLAIAPVTKMTEEDGTFGRQLDCSGDDQEDGYEHQDNKQSDGAIHAPLDYLRDHKGQLLWDLQPYLSADLPWRNSKATDSKKVGDYEYVAKFPAVVLDDLLYFSGG